jgi:hypothetical protein
VQARRAGPLLLRRGDRPVELIPLRRSCRLRRHSLIWINTRRRDAILSRVFVCAGSILQWIFARYLSLIPASIVTAPAFAYSKHNDEHELVKAPLARTVLSQINTEAAPSFRMGDMLPLGEKIRRIQINSVFGSWPEQRADHVT